MEEQDILCPKCKRYGMSAEGNQNKTFLRCMWIDCGFVIDASKYKEPKLKRFADFRKTIKAKKSVMD